LNWTETFLELRKHGVPIRLGEQPLQLQELTTDQLPWRLIRFGLPHSVLKKVINSSFCAGLKSLKP
jgi:hypothetical protein